MMNSKFLPLALLYVNGRGQIEGITRLQKLVFIAQKEEFDEDNFNGYKFKPYKYGPYSEGLTKALELFEERRYIKKEVTTTRNGNEKYTYSLTPNGYCLVRDALLDDNSKDLFDGAESVKEDYNREPIDRVLRYVYNKYPKYAEESKLEI